MKKYLALLLALCLTLGLSLPAAASEDTTNNRLAAVTQIVKDTLELDTSSYTSFEGELQEGAVDSYWSLSWYNDNSELYITATEDGTILSYYRYDDTDNTDDSIPSFPDGDIATARQSATAFLSKVLDSSQETVSMEEEYGDDINSDEYSFYGTILLNGLSSPFSFSIDVRGSDNEVLSFYRNDSDEIYVGDVPSATPAISAEQAALLLKTTLSLKLEYVLPDDSSQAVLRYLPQSGDDYYVDAQTGKLVSLTELYTQLDASGSMSGGGMAAGFGDTTSSSSTDKGYSSGLSDAEESGVEQLEGVLSKTELDTQLQKITSLNLSGYTLGSAYYSLDSEDDDDSQPPVSVSLHYAKQTDDAVQVRTITVDGRTGALKNVSGYSYSLNDDDLTPTVSTTQAQTVAKNFLTSYYGSEFAQTGLYSTSDTEEDDTSVTFTYCQSVNGYFYSGNYFRVTVDLTDGSIQDFDYCFNDAITFDDTDGIVDESAALDTYLGFYTTLLSYVAVPTAIDYTQPQYSALISWGYSYLLTLQLGYQLDNDTQSLIGIDAKTGSTVVIDPDDNDSTSITYDDLDGSSIQSIAEKLASYGIGFDGGSFHADQSITQVELISLILSANGYRHYDITDPDDLERLYTIAYRNNLLTSSERDDSASVTRAELVKILINSAGYQRIAALKDIYNPGFTDDSDIPDGYVGYVALARGLGLIQGDSNGDFRPLEYATHAETISMLYRYLSLS
ncbi:MAG: hypothetical protein H6Q60_476 [Oscillospiraceae bacterium]|nr:hypothetical protein [Oscillospiraceae bacterium]